MPAAFSASGVVLREHLFIDLALSQPPRPAQSILRILAYMQGIKPVSAVGLALALEITTTNKRVVRIYGMLGKAVFGNEVFRIFNHIHFNQTASALQQAPTLIA